MGYHSRSWPRDSRLDVPATAGRPERSLWYLPAMERRLGWGYASKKKTGAGRVSQIR
jgi:hypothetical protein